MPCISAPMGDKSRRPPPPPRKSKDNPLYGGGGPFCYFCSMWGFFCYLFPSCFFYHLWTFSLLFSYVWDLFYSYGGHFWVSPPPYENFCGRPWCLVWSLTTISEVYFINDSNNNIIQNYYHAIYHQSIIKYM